MIQLSSLEAVVAIIEAFFLVLIPYVSKRVVDASIDKSIGSYFNKHLERYKDELSRASMARELVLNKEMAFFDESDKLLAELVPLIQDVREIILNSNYGEREKKNVLRLAKIVPELKDITIKFDAYADVTIIELMQKLIATLQGQLESWYKLVEKVSEGSVVTPNDIESAKNMTDQVLRQLAAIRSRQRRYLDGLSSDESENS